MNKIKLVSPNCPTLWKPAEFVYNIGTQVRPYIKEMKAIMRGETKCNVRKGVGLAAPQVGISLRFFVSDIKGMGTVINPLITEQSEERHSAMEGCLTWPGKLRHKARHNWIYVAWTDMSGRENRKRLTGFDARIFQHELDHLNGICIFGRQ